MNPREFVYIGEPVPKINKPEHKEFLLNLQKAMIMSLEERKLLSKSQTERVLANLITKSNR